MSIDGRNGADIQAPSARRCAAVGAALAAILFALYAPFLSAFDSTDYDALAVVAEIRATGRVVGWPGGFFFQGSLAGAARVALLPFASAARDPLLGYRLAMIACAAGSSLLVYAAAATLTRRVRVSLLAALLHALAPGTLALVLQAEDNLSASFMGTLHACAFLLLVAAYRARGSRARPLAVAAYAAILALSASCHRQLGVLWIAPTFLWLLLPETPRAARARLIAAVYVIAVALFLSLFAALARAWMGRFRFAEWIHFVEGWLFPGRYYRGFYFFNAFGWDLPRQAGEVGAGLRLLVAAPGGARIELAYFAFAIAALIPLRQRRAAAWPVAALALLASVHVPHSLVYESGNLERWDALLAPAAILGAMGASASLRAARSRWPAGAMLAAALAILGYDASRLAARIQSARESAAAPAIAKREDIFRLGLQPIAPGDRAPLLLLAQGEFGESFGLAACRFSYRDSIVIIQEGMRAFRPERPYAQPPREIPWEEFIDLAKSRRLALTPRSRAILRATAPALAGDD